MKMSKKYAPIVLFCFKRLETLILTVEALQKNYMASESDLIIYSDAAKSDLDFAQVAAVREYIQTIVGFKSINIRFSTKNKGLAKSIIDGVTEVFKDHNSIIVLEDDLITSTNFLSFMNQALNFYNENQNVVSISGFSPIVNSLADNQVYFTQRSSSWGWATWRDRWSEVDWETNNYQMFKKKYLTRLKFNRMGSDMNSLMMKLIKGKIDSWAIRFCYHQFVNNLFTVYPSKSKVVNIGFTEEATNTLGNVNRFKTKLDTSENENFVFTNMIVIDRKIIRQFKKPYSILERFKDRLVKTIK
jgi:hypothetical protein